MEEIYFISGNKSKFEEARQIAEEAGITISHGNLELTEIKSLSQEEVVLDKARRAFEKLKKPVIVDDTGIYFEQYKDFPGTFTKFLFRAIGFEGVEKLLENKNRNAFFKTMICYKDSEREKIFSGVWKGKIIEEASKKFNPDWQYNSIFMPEDCNKLLSEMSMEERAKKSHRKKAFDEFAKWVKGGSA